ncbi:MAG: murein L,D-transpeptidase family protein [Phycisphaerales bacterium]
MRSKLLARLAALTLVVAAMAMLSVRHSLHSLSVRVTGKKTVDDRLREFGDAKARVEQHFARAGVAFPPARVVLLGLKQEKRLVVYAAAADGPMRFITDYPIVAASGKSGPKLREGDRQVPEGVYRVESLNPNSRYHVALRVGYPNEFDRAMAHRDRRTNLGGDIMIHGSNGSVGCLAMGDPASEELFVLAAKTGIERVRIILAPLDLRRADPPRLDEVAWQADLYEAIHEAMRDLE